MTCLAAICLTQAWMMWKFINFQLKKWREHSQNQASKKKTVSPKSKPHKRDLTRGESWRDSASGRSSSCIIMCFYFASHACFAFSASHLSYQEALPTGSWSLMIKHHRGQERPKPRRAGRRSGEKSKQSEGVLTVWHHVFTQLQHFSSTALKKKKNPQMFKRTRKPYVTVPLGWELPSDKVQCCCLPEKFINNCSADGTLARRRWFWCFNG